MTKLMPPALGPEVFFAPGRMEWIHDLIDRHRVTLVVAQSGSGKSTLVAGAVATADRPVSWIRWNARDDTPRGVVELFALSLQRIRGEQTTLTSSLFTSNTGVGPDQFVGLLVNDMADIGPMIMVFDDCQTINDPAATDIISTLIDLAPPDVRFVLTARTTPKVPLARFHASGQLARIGPDELRVATAQAQQLLDQHRIAVPHDCIPELVGQTNGWIVGFLMAARAMANGRSIETANGVVADYFAEELLVNEDAEVKQFLRETSILEILVPGVCEAVTRQHNAQQTLDGLRERLGFLVIEVGGVMRYHDLLRDHLKRELEAHASPDEIRALHARASFVTSDELQIEHLFAAHDFKAAAVAIEERSRAWVRHPTADRQVTEWITRLPDDVRDDHPWLDVVLAASGGLSDRDSQVPRVLRAIERADDDDQELRWFAARMLVFATMDLERWRPEVERATAPEFANTHPAMRVELLAAAAWAAHWSARPETSYHHALEAMRLVETSKNETAAESLALHLATPLVLMPGALDRFLQFHQWANEEFGPQSRIIDLATRAHIAMLEVVKLGPVAKGPLDEPDMGLIETFPDMALNLIWIRTSRFHMAADDAGIEATLAPLVLHSSATNGLPFTGLLSAAFRRMGRIQDVQRMVDLVHALPRAMQSSPASKTLAAQLQADLAWVKGDLDAAIALLRPLVDEPGHLRTAPIPDAGCQLAVLLDASGDETGALACLAERVEDLAGRLASPYRVVQAMPIATTLFERLAKREPSEALDSVIAIQRAAHGRNRQRVVPGTGTQLTAREFEVLECLAKGHSNAQIASELFLSANTVKTHVSRVLTKLGVTSRTAAVARARDHQLI